MSAGKRRKALLGAVGAVVVAVIAIMVVAEPFANHSAHAATVALTPQGCVKDDGSSTDCAQSAEGLEGARSVAVSADGSSVYVASSWDSSLVRFDRDPATGALTPQGCVADTIISSASCSQSFYGLAGAESVAVSSDGRSVYVAGSVENAIVRFDRDPSTGALTPIECVQDNDEYLVTCGNTTQGSTANGLSLVQSVAVSPDGKSVYAGSNEDDAIVEFARDTETDVGALTPMGCIDDNSPEGPDDCGQGASGLDGITAVTVSPDNRSVYATSQFDDAIVRFDRDPSTGALTPQGCIDDSALGPDSCASSTAGLDEPWAVTVSPDGRSVYAVGRDSDAIVRFDRDTADGGLTPRGCIESYGGKCPGTTDGMFGPQGVAVSPDGGQVYVGTIIGTVVGFDREPATGALAPAGCVTDSNYSLAGCETTAEGLDGVSSVAFSPGGNSLYATSEFDDSIVRFASVAPAALTGRVFDSHADPVPGAPVEICQSGGSCIARLADGSGYYRASGLADGSYTVTAHPPVGLEAETGHSGPVSVTTGSTTTLNVTLGGPLTPPPAGTSITAVDHSNGGIPSVDWVDDLTLSSNTCAGASSASYRILVNGAEVRSGPMAEQPSGVYTARVQALYPNHGPAVVKIDVTCPSGPPVAIDFGIYIDPSGVVLDASTGAPIAGATVTLLRSDGPGGPFVLVPDGSAMMSPGNRSNPDTTAADGSFGWDVIAGYYKVRASAQGCDTTETAGLSIPPPVTNLRLELSCPVTNPAPPPSAGARATPPPSTTVRPTNRISFGKAKLNAKKGTATLIVNVPGPGSLVLSGRQVTTTRSLARRAGKVSLIVRPKGTARTLLFRTGTATVRVSVTYAPPGGQAGTRSTSVKLVKNRL